MCSEAQVILYIKEQVNGVKHVIQSSIAGRRPRMGV